MSTRVLVPADKHDDFVQTMAGFVQGMVKVGDPADPTVMLGPVIREERRTKHTWGRAPRGQGARGSFRPPASKE